METIEYLKQLLINEKRKYGLEENISKEEIEKLKKNMPIQKIIGYIEMANVKIDVSKNVLIPRYETEELIFIAKKIIKNYNLKTILDLCCGSGFIGIALKKEFKNLVSITQSDIDDNAIEQTSINQKINNIENKIIQSDLFDKINEKFDFIIANPPYLCYKEKKNMTPSVLEFEPHIALFAPNNGMFFYEEIEKNIHNFLNKNGFVLLEINPLNVNWFIKNDYKIIKDINNKDRFALKQII